MAVFAEVAVLSHISGDDNSGFDYIVPDRFYNIVKRGIRVIVPFGSKRLIEGFVVDIKDRTDIPLNRLKAIADIPDHNEVFNEKQILLAKWMSKEYMCSLSDSLRSIIPPEMVLNVKEMTVKGVSLNVEIGEAEELINKLMEDKRSRGQGEVLETVKSFKGPVTQKILVDSFGFSKSSIDTLIKKGILKSDYIRVLRDPYSEMTFPKYNRPSLTGEQQYVIDSIISGFKKGNRNHLIHGVTGSGKTEVYMQLIDYMIGQGRQAIVLVPEISLTPQTIERFKGRFDRVAVIHSRLSSGERYDEWRKVKEGMVDVVVGARSAVFAPFQNLGIIIIDEEHENSYKSDKTPKYHAKDAAYKRCEIEDALLVLGSATPSIETYYESQRGKYAICTMKKRVDNKSLPKIQIADMRQEIVSGNRTIFSNLLYNGIDNALKNKNQVILFLNRRGFSTFVSCRNCGYVMKCPRCDVSLTYHMEGNLLNCHYCGYTVKSPDTCPSCGSKYIKYFGIGTQKVESEVKKSFPDARVLRMDLDTTSKKGSHDRIYNAFKKGEADILIGTQMISKGLDFPGVTLVGIIAADLTLNIPDFKSCERTFQLITQVAGRAGRGDTAGNVVIQTYNPDHYSIQSALYHDYNEFYGKEILVRQSFQYPPFSDLINILVSSTMEQEAEDALKSITGEIRNIVRGFDNIYVLGPSPAPISKINTYFRWQTIIKGKTNLDLKQKIKALLNSAASKKNKIKISFDVNPVSLA